jgi:hypothetical protein
VVQVLAEALLSVWVVVALAVRVVVALPVRLAGPAVAPQRLLSRQSFSAATAKSTS